MRERDRGSIVPYLAVAVVAAGLGAGGTFLAMKGRSSGAPAAGDDLFAVDPSAVTELSLVTPDWRLTALRGDPDDAFTLISSSRKERGVRTCPAGPGFTGVLAAMTTLKARRALSPEEGRRLRASLSKPPFRLTVADDSDLGVASWELVAEPGKPVVGFSTDLPQGAELELDPRQIQLLAQGCEALGAKDR